MNDTLTLSQEQHDIYVFMMNQAPISAEASVKSVYVPNAVTEEHLVVFSQYGDASNNQHAIISLPSISNQVYITITDADPELLCELIARFDAESETNDSMTSGNLTPILENSLLEHGWHGTLIKSVNLIVDGFPKKSPIGGENFEFHLVILLTKEEFDSAMRNGSDPLLKEFQQQGRSLTSFKPQSGGAKGKGATEGAGGLQLSLQSSSPDENAAIEKAAAPPKLTPSNGPKSAKAKSKIPNRTKANAASNSEHIATEQIKAAALSKLKMGRDNLPSDEIEAIVTTVIQQVLEQNDHGSTPTDVNDDRAETFAEEVDNNEQPKESKSSFGSIFETIFSVSLLFCGIGAGFLLFQRPIAFSFLIPVIFASIGAFLLANAVKDIIGSK